MPSNATGRGRPRDPELAQRVLVAAMQEYARTGWTGFTMDAVARRARVGKSALYLRWPSKEKLLVEALEAHSARLMANDPDTGTLREDLTALATTLLDYLLDPGGWVALRALVDASVQAADAGVFHDRIIELQIDAADRVVRRAIDRRELSPDAPTRTMLEVLFGAVLMRVIAMSPDERDTARGQLGRHVTPLIEFVVSGAARHMSPGSPQNNGSAPPAPEAG
jgi:AcrR family transcriptional regulator